MYACKEIDHVSTERFLKAGIFCFQEDNKISYYDFHVLVSFSVVMLVVITFWSIDAMVESRNSIELIQDSWLRELVLKEFRRYVTSSPSHDAKGNIT